MPRRIVAQLSCLASLPPLTALVGHLMRRSVEERRAAMRHTTVSPRNPFCVAWGGRGVHRMVDVGHAEYRAGGRLAAECTLHCWHTLLCNCWHSALHTSCRLERHTVGTAWIAAREVGRVEARIAAAMARPRGDGATGGEEGLGGSWGETRYIVPATLSCQYVCNATSRPHTY